MCKKKKSLFALTTSPSIPLCALINQYLTQLARKFPATKFLKSISTVCIPNYPDRNLPTMFIYCEGDMKGQIVSAVQFGGMNLSVDGEFGWCMYRVQCCNLDNYKNNTGR